MRILLTLAAALAAAACGASSAPTPLPSPAPAAADTPDADGFLPPAFTADELRAGLPAGTVIELHVDVAGEAPVIQRWTFTAADASGATIHGEILDEAGALLRDEGEGTSTWAELSAHGRFPAARTTRTASEVEVPAGRFTTWRYEVLPDAPGGPVQRLQFAPALPGPPVHMEVVQDGRVVVELRLRSRTAP